MHFIKALTVIEVKYCRKCQSSNNSITFGSKAVFNSGTTYDVSIAFDSTEGKVVICYRDFSNSNHGTAVVGTVNPSNNSITFGSETSFRGFIFL